MANSLRQPATKYIGRAVSNSITHSEAKDAAGYMFGNGANQMGLRIHNDSKIHDAISKISEKMLSEPTVVEFVQKSIEKVLSKEQQREMEKILSLPDQKFNEFKKMLDTAKQAVDESKAVHNDIERCANHAEPVSQTRPEADLKPPSVVDQSKLYSEMLKSDTDFQPKLMKRSESLVSGIKNAILSVMKNLMGVIWPSNDKPTLEVGNRNPALDIGNRNSALEVGNGEVKTTRLISLAVTVASLVMTMAIFRRFLRVQPGAQPLMLQCIREKHFEGVHRPQIQNGKRVLNE